jgi:membrane dipeptidase
MNEFRIVDAHLDLALNIIENKIDHIQTIAELRSRPNRESQQAMTSLSEFSKGNIVLVFATLFANPADKSFAADLLGEAPGYTTPEEAELQALEQLNVYESWAATGRVRLITSRVTFEEHLRLYPTDRKPGLLILMEGADPIKTPEEVEKWWTRGVRAVGLTWGRTRYAGGTGAPGGLTLEGRELLAAMRERGLILDTSHLAEAAFFEALEFYPNCVMASHSNPRVLLSSSEHLPSDRHLSDEMIHALGTRGGVIGLNLISPMLDSRWFENKSIRVSIFDQCRWMLEHNAALIGWDKVGIGSDLDAGMGLDDSPLELDTIADVVKFTEVVPREARAGVLGENWLRFLLESLPIT